MKQRILACGVVAVVICLQTPAMPANFKIDNPAANIYNPATNMDNPSPISPPTQAIPKPEVIKVITEAVPVEQVKEQPRPKPQLQTPPKPAIPKKSYNFKTVGAYVNAAKKAFIQDDYREFISITENALGRIDAGTLKASKKTRQKLTNYRTFGYGLLQQAE
ncbi:MAG: hypothetical protein Q7V04_00295 [Deltaproteobacteria bacterium]|nr:hypothetical protein [Deltaproteobacteria bacterium]